MIVHPTRRGFALPSVILLLLLMTAGVMAAFARATAENRVVDNGRAQTAAFAVAEAGLHRYLARGRTTPADTTMVVPGGRARVRISLVRAAATSDTVLYLIRSDGVVAGGARIPEGRRTVAQYAYHLRGRIRVTATWSSLGGLYKAGSAGAISGADECGQDSIAGVQVPDGMYTYSGDDISPLAGSPPLEELGTTAAMATAVKIDWPGITNPLARAGNVDVIVCYPGTIGYDGRFGPCASWPAKSMWSDADYWPVILVNGSVRLPDSGRGTLLVTGDLTLRGNDSWAGLLMIGNSLTDNGTGTINGAVFSGLNALNGGSPSESRANGTKRYLYDSCAIEKAADRQSRFVQISNAWVDNVAAW
jgi:hypothetical protein